MKIFYIALCLLAIFSISTVEAAKKRKKKSNVSHRPGNIEPYLYCVSCLAVGREILRKVRFDRSEVNIYDALTNICNPNNYMVYHLPPPDLSKGCTAFLNGNEETIVDVLLNTKNMSEIGEVLCYNETQACVGVDLDNPPEIQDEYEVNGVVYTRNKNVTGRGSPEKPEKKELEAIEDNNDVSSTPVSSEPLEGNLEIPTVPDDVRNKEKEPIKPISDEEFVEENHKKRKINDPQVPRNEKGMNKERAPQKPENHQKVKGIDLEKEQEIGKEKALDIEL